MKIRAFAFFSAVTLFAALTISIQTFAQNTQPISAPQADATAQAKILNQYGKLPLSFEANQGQTDARVKFLSRTSRYTLLLTGDEAVLTLSGSKTTTRAKIVGTDHISQSGAAASKAGGVLRMKLRNASPVAKVTGTDELPGTSNYFIGNDPRKWTSNVPTYAKVKYEGIYSGIDLVYYGNQRQLEYDFVVAPGADPSRIQFDVRGAKSIRQDGNGELVFKMGEDEIRWHKPIVYQENDGTREEIAARYAIADTNRVRFELAKYDANRPLYIDPLIYSTYLGGSGSDSGMGIAVDTSGNAYMTGQANSTNFPTMNPLQPANAGGLIGNDVFVAKLNPAGNALLYSTYLGGSGDDSGQGIAVDSVGNAYVTGLTFSTGFPTMNPLQPTYGGNGDAFVAKISPTGSALVYSTYLGGSGEDQGSGIAVDISGNAYISGSTQSTNFPTMNPFQPANGGSSNAFVAKITSGPRYSVCLLYDPTKAVHSGATIPLKLQLCDGSGNDLSSSSITVHAISVTQISTSSSGAVENAGNSNPDSDFRFDATLGSTGGYIFNLKTTGLSTGTYKVNFTVTGDTFVYATNFEVK